MTKLDLMITIFGIVEVLLIASWIIFCWFMYRRERDKG